MSSFVDHFRRGLQACNQEAFDSFRDAFTFRQGKVCQLRFGVDESASGTVRTRLGGCKKALDKVFAWMILMEICPWLVIWIRTPPRHIAPKDGPEVAKSQAKTAASSSRGYLLMFETWDPFVREPLSLQPGRRSKKLNTSQPLPSLIFARRSPGC